MRRVTKGTRAEDSSTPGTAYGFATFISIAHRVGGNRRLPLKGEDDRGSIARAVRGSGVRDLDA